MAWRRLLKVRSLAQAEQVWESSKYEVPLYVKWVRAAQKVKATAYNAEKAVDEYLTGEKEKTVQVAFMVRVFEGRRSAGAVLFYLRCPAPTDHAGEQSETGAIGVQQRRHFAPAAGRGDGGAGGGRRGSRL